jgi:hypothetical protein
MQSPHLPKEWAQRAGDSAQSKSAVSRLQTKKFFSTPCQLKVRPYTSILNLILLYEPQNKWFLC